LLAAGTAGPLQQVNSSSSSSSSRLLALHVPEAKHACLHASELTDRGVGCSQVLHATPV
jgi:hypothetical protein